MTEHLSHQGKHAMATKQFDFRQPHDVPTFTLADVKDAIPKHCFERNAITSLSFFARDVFLCSFMIFTTLFYNTIALKIASFTALFGCDTTVLTPLITAASTRQILSNSAIAFFKQPFILKSLFLTQSLPLVIYSIVLTGLWIVFWWLQGVFMTGIWVLGHEAGHGAMFSNKLANDTFGLITHSFLLVPYFAWQISHRRHHSHCGDMDLDEVHLPWHINEIFSSSGHGNFHNDKKNNTVFENNHTFLNEMYTLINDYSLLWRVLNTAVFCIIGWWLYLTTNVSGRRYEITSEQSKPNHFTPSSPIFNKEERQLILIGDFALICYIIAFFKFTTIFGFSAFCCLYFIPYVVTNWWLVTITLLQHTHPALPHFSSARWNYIQGALSTIDRDYGDFYNWALHNINDTHVTHHMFSYLPHYHAEEATESIKKVIGPYYLKIHDERPTFGVIKSLLACWNDFHFISEDHHPALTIAHESFVTLHESLEENKSCDKTDDIIKNRVLSTIDKVKHDAFNNSPYGPDNKQNDTSKEVYWFRTMSFLEQGGVQEIVTEQKQKNE